MVIDHGDHIAGLALALSHVIRPVLHLATIIAFCRFENDNTKGQ